MRLFFCAVSDSAPRTPFRHLRNLGRLRFCFLALSIRAADLILATWITESPPALVEQSSPDFAPHKVQIKLIGLVGRISGIINLPFAMPATYHIWA